MNFWEWQARRRKPGEARAPEPDPTDTIPEIKLGEDPPLGFEQGIKVEESTVSDTFIGRMRADIRKLWGADK
jgi:hypothetical protein